MSSKAKLTPTPVRLDEDMLARVRKICELNPWVSMSDVFRFSMQLGIAALERGASVRLRGLADDDSGMEVETPSPQDAENAIKEALTSAASRAKAGSRKKK